MAIELKNLIDLQTGLEQRKFDRPLQGKPPAGGHGDRAGEGSYNKLFGPLA
jgi:hypothetical protein